MPTVLLNPIYAEQSEKEEYLRLRWYLKHNAKFKASAEKETYKVSDEDKEGMAIIKVRMVNNSDRIPRPPENNDIRDLETSLETLETPAASTDANKYVGQTSKYMKPVLIDDDDLIYKKSRVAYLKKRCLLLPEKRYHYKETSGFEYGWKMWDCAKTMEMKRYGKSAVIRQTFYRRRAGIEKDPDWYRTPLRISPTICNA